MLSHDAKSNATAKKIGNMLNFSFNILIFKTSLLCSTFKNTTFCEDTKTIAKKAEQYYEIIIKPHIIRPFCNGNFHKQKVADKEHCSLPECRPFGRFVFPVKTLCLIQFRKFGNRPTVTIGSLTLKFGKLLPILSKHF